VSRYWRQQIVNPSFLVQKWDDENLQWFVALDDLDAGSSA